MTCDLQQPPHPLMTSTLMDAGRASDRARAASWSEAILSYKTNGEGIDSHGIDKGLMRGVELHESFLASSD
jgi:hypothetical protein